MHADAERIARRFVDVASALDAKLDTGDLDYELMVMTFDEMLRAELIFGGPSLYADPAV
jgi:hypothetical protein